MTNSSPNQDPYKKQATDQLNQLRIALITISVGISAFLSKDIDNTLSLLEFKFLYLALMFSILAAISGLLGWYSSAKMFYSFSKYSLKEKTECETWHNRKNWCDRLLNIFLILAVIICFMHLQLERRHIGQKEESQKPAVTNIK